MKKWHFWFLDTLEEVFPGGRGWDNEPNWALERTIALVGVQRKFKSVFNKFKKIMESGFGLSYDTILSKEVEDSCKRINKALESNRYSFRKKYTKPVIENIGPKKRGKQYPSEIALGVLIGIHIAGKSDDSKNFIYKFLNYRDCLCKRKIKKVKDGQTIYICNDVYPKRLKCWFNREQLGGYPFSPKNKNWKLGKQISTIKQDMKRAILGKKPSLEIRTSEESKLKEKILYWTDRALER